MGRRLDPFFAGLFPSIFLYFTFLFVFSSLLAARASYACSSGHAHDPCPSPTLVKVDGWLHQRRKKQPCWAAFVFFLSFSSFVLFFQSCISLPSASNQRGRSILLAIRTTCPQCSDDLTVCLSRLSRIVSYDVGSDASYLHLPELIPPHS